MMYSFEREKKKAVGGKVEDNIFVWTKWRENYQSISEGTLRLSSLETRLRGFEQRRKTAYWLYWTKDFEYGAVRHEGKRKTKEKVYGCSDGEMEADDPLWHLLKGEVERK